MDPPQDDDHHQHNNSSPASFKQKFKSSLFCFPKSPHHQVHHRGETVTSTVDKKPRLVRCNSLRTKSRPEGYSADHHDINELKHRCKNFISRMGSGRKLHARRHSADFKYDALSYSLNFEEEDPRSEDFPYRDFSARLPRTPPSTDVYNIESIDHQGRTACS